MFRLGAKLDETKVVIPAASNEPGQPGHVSYMVFEIIDRLREARNVQELADISLYGRNG